MSTKRPSVTSISDLIQKYQGSDFDVIAELSSRISILEQTVGSTEDLEQLIQAIPLIESFLVNDAFVSAPLLSNPVDYSAEGFSEDELGTILGAFALLSKINEADIATLNDPLHPYFRATTAQGTGYTPITGNWDPAFIDVEQVLDALKSTFTQSGRILLADSVTQGSPVPYTTPNVPANVTNDGLIANDFSQAVPGRTSFYNLSLQQLEFSQFTIGDILRLRLDIEVNTTNADQEVDLQLSLAEGSPEFKTLRIDVQKFPDPGNYIIVREITFVVDSLELRTNPGHIQITSDYNATITTNSFELFMQVKDG